MNEEMVKRLDALGEKLGATGQYLWTVLVKGEFAYGLSYSILALIAMAVLGRIAYSKREDFWDDPAAFFACLAFLVAFITLATNLPSVFSPEYAALKTVLAAMRGH